MGCWGAPGGGVVRKKLPEGGEEGSMAVPGGRCGAVGGGDSWRLGVEVVGLAGAGEVETGWRGGVECGGGVAEGQGKVKEGATVVDRREGDSGGVGRGYGYAGRMRDVVEEFGEDRRGRNG
ncbi:hypothetical protein Tco_0888239 [Tanacetum coccineum]